MSSACTLESLTSGEPIEGTAVERTWRWLGIEHRGPWPSEGPSGIAWPPAVARRIDAFLSQPGSRVQLLRRPGRRGPLTVFSADTTPGAEAVGRLTVPDTAAIAELDLGGGAPVAGPLLWVCTHGSRDRCCGSKGGRVFTALDAHLGDAVWQTSHLGGHRFAPTLLALPHGISWGRLLADDLDPLLACVREDRLYDLDRFRGRTAFSAPAQAAEAALRRHLDLAGIGAVSHLAETREQERATLHLGAAGSRWELVMERAPLGSIVASCGASPSPRFSWRLASLTAIPDTRDGASRRR